MNPSIQDQIAEQISLMNKLERDYERKIKEIRAKLWELQQKLDAAQ